MMIVDANNVYVGCYSCSNDYCCDVTFYMTSRFFFFFFVHHEDQRDYYCCPAGMILCRFYALHLHPMYLTHLYELFNVKIIIMINICTLS